MWRIPIAGLCSLAKTGGNQGEGVPKCLRMLSHGNNFKLSAALAGGGGETWSPPGQPLHSRPTLEPPKSGLLASGGRKTTGDFKAQRGDLGGTENHLGAFKTPNAQAKPRTECEQNVWERNLGIRMF